MPDFGAKDVKALRDATGAGMMDAKKALTEAGGDAEAATQILRVKGMTQNGYVKSRPVSKHDLIGNPFLYLWPNLVDRRC